MSKLEAQKALEQRTEALGAALLEPYDDPTRRKSQASVIVEFCGDFDLFRADDEAYAAVMIEGRRQTVALRSMAMRHELSRRYYQATKSVAGKQAIEDALGVLTGRAIHEGGNRPVHTRIAAFNNDIFIDLCDEAWRAIHVNSSGWRIVNEPPVHFIRRRGMLPLPDPRHGGTVNDLRRFINVADDTDFRRIVGWLVQGLRPRGPYPILALNGEQGSAKSTASRLVRSLIDPNAVMLRTAPRDERDLVISARNGWCLAFDNLSGLPPWLSDSLCRLSTGGGFSARQLYSDADEILIDVSRPVVINGLDAIATRPDLADRSVVVTLELIQDCHRRTEGALWREFAAAAPGILGALLDATACALANVHSVRLAILPRMADHAVWLEAASPALNWPPGQYVDEYIRARNAIVASAADASPVSSMLMSFIDKCGSWSGTASALLAELNREADSQVTRSRQWPNNAIAMGNEITRQAPALRARGYTVERLPGHKNGRLIKLGLIDKSLSPSSSRVPSSAVEGGTDGDGGDDVLRTIPKFVRTPEAPDSGFATRAAHERIAVL